MLRLPGIALLAAFALAAPAQAATWLDPQLPFGPSPSDPVEAGAAMGPDGTIVFARFTPDGALEAGERPPGGPVGDTVTIPPDDEGADTAVFTVLLLPSFTVTPLARHRERGGPWGQVENVSLDDVVAEKLVAGHGAPALVLRSESGHSVTTRGAGGAWTPPAPLLRGDAASLDAARTGAGTTVFAWVDRAHVVGRVLGADGRLDDPHDLAEGINAAIRGVGADADGDAVALYTEPGDGGFVLQASGYDGAGPRITALSTPRAGIAGQGLPLAVETLDVWSGRAATARWTFGDGDIEHGVAVGHTYATAGDYTVGVDVKDAVGNVTSATRDLAIAAQAPLSAPTTPPPDRHPPHLKKLSLGPKHPRANRAPVLRFTTDLAGELRVTLTRTARGGRCVARRSGRRPCTRTLAVHRLRGPVERGTVRFALPRLAAGSWRLTAVEESAAGDTSRPAQLRFVVGRAARPRS